MNWVKQSWSVRDEHATEGFLPCAKSNKKRYIPVVRKNHVPGLELQAEWELNTWQVLFCKILDNIYLEVWTNFINVKWEM